VDLYTIMLIGRAEKGTRHFNPLEDYIFSTTGSSELKRVIMGEIYLPSVRIYNYSSGQYKISINQSFP
jgi:hypothetical protein